MYVFIRLRFNRAGSPTDIDIKSANMIENEATVNRIKLKSKQRIDVTLYQWHCRRTTTAATRLRPIDVQDQMLITLHVCKQNKVPTFDLCVWTLSVGSFSASIHRRVINWFHSFTTSVALPYATIHFYAESISRSLYFVALTVQAFR